MALEEYKRKRNFKETQEPKGVLNQENKQRFVVQRHRATKLHFDLRLEIEGVLKSWAVPKGPSLNPADKRLAIQTEDHPVKYLTFHGIIPKGNYGAGEMSIWDEGVFSFKETAPKDIEKQWEKGSLKIIFEGKKMKGEFALVRTHQDEHKKHWLLIKKDDDYATQLAYDAENFKSSSTKVPIKSIESEEIVRPMLATASKKLPENPEWIYELKWDGYRMISNINQGKVSCYSRNGISYHKKFNVITKQLETISQEVILDGEIVALDEEGKPNFQALQNYPKENWGQLRYYVFDMLYLNGHSMLELPLLDRKSFIKEVIEDCTNIFYCDHIEGMGSAFLQKSLDEGMEGVMAKKIDSIYQPGQRTKDWLKIKAVQTQEALICGFTDSEKNGSIFGSLILGMFKDEKLVYIGNCGTGYSEKEQEKLYNSFKDLLRKNSPFSMKINLKGRTANWLQPSLICEVKFSEWTRNSRLRHPVYKGLREDKNLNEVVEEKEIESQIENKKKQKGSKKNVLEIDGIAVPVSNIDKVLWPKNGFRKYELIDYYLNIADYILPYLKDRPQNLHRHPNGIAEKGFYQKDNEGLLQDWIDTVPIYSKSSDREIEYLLCQQKATLIYMANLGCIEINPWHSKIDNLENPDYLVIDLDPSPKNSFDEVVEVAQATKVILDAANIQGFCKTSGSRGLHIYLPLAAEYTYEEARDFTKLLCYYILEKVPKLATMERNVKKRNGKIYLDYLQNRKSQTIASPYCVRPKPEAPVSTPLEWKEVKKGLKLTDYNINSIFERLKEKGDIFQSVLGNAISIENALESLEK